MYSLQDNRALPLLGYPIRKSPDQTPACGSPRLIAACHVLHRLSAPRHPPCTLSSLTKLECLSLSESYRLDSIQLSKNSKLIKSVLASNSTRRMRGVSIGGADRDRTDDIRLAKAALSQLSYSPKAENAPSNRTNRTARLGQPACWKEHWWAQVDSNYRPHAYQACALTN